MIWLGLGIVAAFLGLAWVWRQRSKVQAASRIPAQATARKPPLPAFALEESNIEGWLAQIRIAIAERLGTRAFALTTEEILSEPLALVGLSEGDLQTLTNALRTGDCQIYQPEGAHAGDWPNRPALLSLINALAGGVTDTTREHTITSENVAPLATEISK